MRKTLFLVMLGCVGVAQAASVNLTLPAASDFEWIAGAGAEGIGNKPTAAGVAKIAQSAKTDITGWFGGTGQGHGQNTEIAITGAQSFDFMSRPRYSGQYVMMGTALTEEVDSITLAFENSGKLYYSIWSYDTTAGTATELLAATHTTAGKVEQTYTGTVAAGAQLFVVWSTGTDTNFCEGGGIKISVSGITLSATTAGIYHWAPANATGNGTWAGDSWKENNEGTAAALPGTGEDVIFNNTAHAAAVVSLGGNAQAGTVTLTGGTYTFRSDTAAALSVADHLLLNGADATFEVNITADRVTVESGSLTAQTITVGNSEEDAFSVSGGNVSVNTIAGKGKVQITGGKVEVKNYITASGGTTVDGATLTGNTKLDGSKGSPLSLGGLSVDADSVQLGNATLSAPITLTRGTLHFSGMMILSKVDSFAHSQSESYSAANNSGYLTLTDQYTVVTGNLDTLSSDANWLVGGKSGQLKSDGKVHIQHATDTSVYWVRSTTVADAAWVQTLADHATPTVQLDAGTLQLDHTYESAALITGSGVLSLQEPAELRLEQLATNAADLRLSGTGTYHTGGSLYLHAAGGVSLAQDWAGTVNVGSIESASAVALSGMANASSSLQFERVEAPSLSVESAGPAIKQAAFNTLILTAGDSVVNAAAVTVDHLYLGSAAAAASLTVNGELNLTQSTVYVEHQDSTLTAARLADGITTLNFVMDSNLLANATGENVLLTLTGADADYADIQLTLNGNAANERTASAGSKHAYNLAWDPAQSAVVLHAVTNPDYVLQKYSGATGNAAVGARMLNDAFVGTDPQGTAPGSDLAKLLDSVDADALSQDALAGAAGSSIASLGMAFSGDVERQLRAIRNRTTTMGVNQSHAHSHLPYFNAWVNAEANHAELDSQAQYPGYTLNSWGGTLGVDADITPHLTLGLAVTAMYGDFSTNGPDHADGDADTYYLSLFGRYTRRAWTHTFVATAGLLQVDAARTVSHPQGSYTNRIDTEGSAFGLLYELGRVFAWNDSRRTCIQPVFNVAYRHVGVDAFCEQGGNAALSASDQSLDTLTLGLGARIQSEVGESIFNRSSLLEARILARLDLGDRSSSVDVAMLHAASAGTVESEEISTFGVELGAGLTIPVGIGGAFFIDASAELRSGYTNFNGTVGYRINF